MVLGRIATRKRSKIAMSNVILKQCDNDSWLRTTAIMVNRPDSTLRTTIGQIQNVVGHCCGASFLCHLNDYPNFWCDEGKVEAFFKQLEAGMDDQLMGEGRNNTYSISLSIWPLQGLYVFLSEETEGYDMGIRKNKRVKEVHNFMNYASYSSGRVVSLFYVELSK